MEQMYEKLLDERDLYIKNLVEKYNQAVAHIDLQQQCIAQLTQQNQELETRVHKFLVENSRQDVLVKQLQTQLATLKDKESQLLETMKKQLEEKAMETGKAVQDLRKELLSEQRSQQQKVASKLAKAQEQIRKLQGVQDRRKDQIHNLRLANQQLSRPKIDNQVPKLMNTVDFLEKQALHKEKEAQKLALKLAQYQASLINLQAQEKVLKERLALEQSSNMEQRNSLLQRIRQLKGGNQSLKSQLRSLAEKNEQLRISNKQYLAQIKNLKPRYQRMILSLQEKAKQLQISVWNLQDQLAFLVSSPLNHKPPQSPPLNLTMQYVQPKEPQIPVLKLAQGRPSEKRQSKQEEEWQRLTTNLLKIVE